MLRTPPRRPFSFLLRGLGRCVSYVQGQSPSPKTREYFYYIDHQGQLFLDDARLKNFITCFKDKKFLAFFFRRIKPNDTGRYQDDFPFVSPCGPEMNYIRCDDLPVVFTHLLDSEGKIIENIAQYIESIAQYGTEEGTTPSGDVQYSKNIAQYGPEAGSSTRSDSPTASNSFVPVVTERLSYGGTGDKLSIPFEPSGLCMLPGSGRVYHRGLEKLGGVGLVKSSLAIELSRFFVYDVGSDENSAPTKFVWWGRTWRLDPTVLKRLELHKS